LEKVDGKHLARLANQVLPSQVKYNPSGHSEDGDFTITFKGHVQRTALKEES
jgi:hypothetical protein